MTTTYGSLRKANRGTACVIFGQSNANRCGNKTQSAAAAGYIKPASATYWDIQTQAGTALSSYSAPFHGPETGFLRQLCEVQGKSITLVKRGMDGTSLAQWNSTHCATLKADCVTAGIVPKFGILIQGENEGTASEVAANGWDTDLIAVMANLRRAWGASFGLLIVQLSNLYDATWRDNVRVRQLYASQNFWHTGPLIDIDGLALDADETHHTSATSSEVGRLAALAAVQYGLIP